MTCHHRPYLVIRFVKMAEDMSEGRKCSDSGMRFVSKMNGVEGKTPFLIGVAGGTASGKVSMF